MPSSEAHIRVLCDMLTSPHPQKDALSWIHENYKSYHFYHCIALVASLTSDDGPKPLELAKEVQKLYVEDLDQHQVVAGHFEI